jgi:hypothetical protein
MNKLILASILFIAPRAHVAFSAIVDTNGPGLFELYSALLQDNVTLVDEAVTKYENMKPPADKANLLFAIRTVQLNDSLLLAASQGENCNQKIIERLRKAGAEVALDKYPNIFATIECPKFLEVAFANLDDESKAIAATPISSAISIKYDALTGQFRTIFESKTANAANSAKDIEIIAKKIAALAEVYLPLAKQMRSFCEKTKKGCSAVEKNEELISQIKSLSARNKEGQNSDQIKSNKRLGDFLRMTEQTFYRPFLK